MRPGEIYLAQFPFGDVPGMKLRPVLLLTGPLGAIPEVLVAYISSVILAQYLPTDLLLDPNRPEFPVYSSQDSIDIAAAQTCNRSLLQPRTISLDLSRFLRQPVKTQNPLNGELSHGIVS